MIPVCYCGNAGIFNGVLLSLLSLLNRTNEDIDVYLLTMDLTDVNEKFSPFNDEQINLLQSVLKSKNNGGKVTKLDVGNYYREYFLGTTNEKTGYTPYSMIRLFLDFLPVPDKLIYLDADLMFTGDIKQLYDEEIEGYEFGAVKDFMGTFWINKNYCNSGVLLLNMPEIKQTRLFEKCRSKVAKTKMFMPDQSALNFLVNNKKILPRKYNEQRSITQDTVIKHFCKGIKWLPFFHIYNIKQWQRDKVINKLGITCFNGEYEEFDRITGRK